MNVEEAGSLARNEFSKDSGDTADERIEGAEVGKKEEEAGEEVKFT